MNYKAKKYLQIIFLILIFQISLFDNYKIIVISAIPCLSISFIIETWNNWSGKKLLKFLIYFIVFLFVWIISFVSKIPYGTTILFTIFFNVFLSSKQKNTLCENKLCGYCYFNYRILFNAFRTNISYK